MSSSGSDRSSATPPPQIITKKKKQSKDKGKQKAASATNGKNEGDDPNWAYAPPTGSVLIENKDVDAGQFDWDAVKDDDDLELWLIRIPDSVKIKHLENLQVDVPSSSTSSCVGTLKRKHVTYDIWSVGEDDSQPIGGEELKGISALLPRKSKKGKLYSAPKPIAHHLVFAAQPVTPSPPGTEGETSISYKNPPRQSYPSDVLTHRFLPYGSLANVTNVETSEDVAMVEAEALPEDGPSILKKKKSKKAEEEPADEVLEPEMGLKKTKGKKRKGDAGEVTDTPAKKSKKTKITSE